MRSGPERSSPRFGPAGVDGESSASPQGGSAALEGLQFGSLGPPAGTTLGWGLLFVSIRSSRSGRGGSATT